MKNKLLSTSATLMSLVAILGGLWVLYVSYTTENKRDEAKTAPNVSVVQDRLNTPFLEYAKYENIRKRMMGEDQDFRFYLVTPERNYVTVNLDELYKPLSLK